MNWKPNCPKRLIVFVAILTTLSATAETIIQTSRYEVKNVKDPYSDKSILIKIDTETGVAWEYKVVKTENGFTVNGWLVIPENIMDQVSSAEKIPASANKNVK